MPNILLACNFLSKSLPLLFTLFVNEYWWVMTASALANCIPLWHFMSNSIHSGFFLSLAPLVPIYFHALLNPLSNTQTNERKTCSRTLNGFNNKFDQIVKCVSIYLCIRISSQLHCRSKLFDLLMCVCAVRAWLCIWFSVNTRLYSNALAFVSLFKNFQYHFIITYNAVAPNKLEEKKNDEFVDD